MPRNYRIYHPCAVQSGFVRIDDAETLHYLKHVLRLREGDRVVLFGGDSLERICRIKEMDSTGIQVEIENTDTPATEPSIRIHLGIAVGKGYKLDEVVESTTALGVYSIHPFVALRSVTERRNPERLERLKKIAISACRQSGRVQVPQILPVHESLHSLLKDQTWPWLLFADEVGGNDMIPFLVGPGREKVDELALFIGPEGGWSEEERFEMKSLGGYPVSLGPRILRMELAAAAAVFLIERLFSGSTSLQA